VPWRGKLFRSCALSFALDLKDFKDGLPLGVQEVPDGSVESETIVVAALPCPYKAIFVTEIEHYEELAP
jgi:hypothetical protein